MDKILNVIVHPRNHGWILDTIAKQITDRALKLGISSNILYSFDHIPLDSTVFVTHYSILPYIFALNPSLENVGVYFTHESADLRRFIPFLNRCRSIIVSNDREFLHLIDAGVNLPIIHIVPEGDDPNLWKSHRRLERKILISHAFYERKNPQLILDVIKDMPERQFLLLGKDWEKWGRFSELKSLPNLEIKQNVPYSEYPKIYEECDVYFSASTLEGGGPHSLIEAMMCNMVPVVSMTGNYREYIANTYNGFYFKPTEKVKNIVTMLEIAYTLDTDVSKTVRGFTWEVFVKEILESLSLAPITEPLS
jgi:glycosyltransferase involved in cell wall biosynthesis